MAEGADPLTVRSEVAQFEGAPGHPRDWSLLDEREVDRRPQKLNTQRIRMLPTWHQARDLVPKEALGCSWCQTPRSELARTPTSDLGLPRMLLAARQSAP